MRTVCIFLASGFAVSAADGENAVKEIRECKHALLVRYDNGKISTYEIYKSKSSKELNGLMFRLKNADYAGITATKLVCFYDIKIKGEKVGIGSKVYDVVKEKFVIIPRQVEMMEIKELFK